MLTTTNIHNVKDIRIDRYNHSIEALVFAFDGNDGDRQETAVFGIKPASAIKIMAILATDKTQIYYKDKTLTIGKYVEELAVQEVLSKMGEGDGKNLPF